LSGYLDIDFSSDPRRARFPLPGQDLPEFLAGEPSVPLGRMKVTAEIAYDLVVNRIYREGMTPGGLPRRQPHQPGHLDQRGPQARPGRGAVGEVDHHTPNALYFTPDGYTLDGQHRSCAWLLSYILGAREGIAFEPPSVPVVGNVPWSSFSKIDTGLPRQGHQFLSLPDPSGQR
jgi:hypothetical protein